MIANIARQLRWVPLVIILCALLVGLPAGQASADPVLGGTLVYAGGDVSILVIDAAAAFHNFLDIYSPGGTMLIDLPIENHGDFGLIGVGDPPFTLPAATIAGAGIAPGDEVVFGIFVSDTGFTYLMGPGSRNPDGIEHAKVDDLGGGLFHVGFEDLFGGGDLDFDDTLFEFRGGLRVPSRVPAPAPLVLLGAALAGLAALERVRRSSVKR